MGLLETLITEGLNSTGEGYYSNFNLFPTPFFGPTKLDTKTRYLQLAFNGDINTARGIIPFLPKSERIFVEAGTPFIKRYGKQGIQEIASMWGGIVVADIKTVDGATQEVKMAVDAGAHAVTVVGAASKETLNLFVKECKKLGAFSMIDMIGVPDPLKAIRKLEEPPTVAILHLGRDEETSRGKSIQYTHVNRIKSKYDVLISAAGGVGLKESRSAIFNGANIVVVNIVGPSDPWKGINVTEDVPGLANEFLKTIE